MRRFYFLSIVVIAILFAAGLILGATGNLRIPIPSSTATTGDLIYVNASDNTLTNLASTTVGSLVIAGGAGTAPTYIAPGANGAVLQGSGITTAPAYIAKNIGRIATVDFLNTRTTQTLSADQMLCKMLIVQSGGDTAVIVAPDVTGTEFIIRNLLTTAVTVTGGAVGSSCAASATTQIMHNGTSYVHVSTASAN